MQRQERISYQDADPQFEPEKEFERKAEGIREDELAYLNDVLDGDDREVFNPYS